MSPNATLPPHPPRVVPPYNHHLPLRRSSYLPYIPLSYYMYIVCVCRTTVVRSHPVTTTRKAVPSLSHVSAADQLYHSSCTNTRTPLSDQRRRHVVSPRLYIRSNSAATFQLLFVFRFYDDVLLYFPPRIVRRFYPPLRRRRHRFYRRPSHPSREDYTRRA